MEEIISGALYLVSTPIGNLADISFRAVHILKNVDFIAAEDKRTTAILLKHYLIKKQMIPFHSYNQKKQTPQIIAKLKNNNSAALVSDAGTPGISDPAYELVKECVNQKIKIIPIPGASALLASLVVSGLPVNRFVFEGFLPLKKGRQKRIQELSQEKRTLVFYESPYRILKTVTQLHEIFGNRRAVLGREITKMFEEFLRGNLSDLMKHIEKKQLKGEIVLIVEGAGSLEKNLS